MEAKELFDDSTEGFMLRIQNRMGTFGKSTMALVKSFMEDGDDKTTANEKVMDLSNEIALIGNSALILYWAGNTKPLIDAVNDSQLISMTVGKKKIVTDILSRISE